MAEQTTELLSGILRPLQPARDTLLRGVLVPEVEGGYSRRDVLLAGGKIEAIEPAGSIERARAAEVLECEERMLLPGFVNGHTHSSEHWVRGLIQPLPLELWVLQLLRHEARGDAGWHGEASFAQTPAFAIGVSALHCGIEAVASGCTALLDHLFSRSADDVAAAVAVYKALGVRAFIAPMVSDDAEMYHNYVPLCASAEARNAECGCAGCGGLGPGGALRTEPCPRDPAKTQAALELWEECIRRFHRPDEGIEIVVGPVTAFSASAELLRGAAALREKHGVCGHTHLLETRAQALQSRQWFEHGSSVRRLHESGFLQLPGTSCAHAVWLSEEEAGLMAASGASVSHCPWSNLRLGSGVCPLAAYEAAGVNVCLGCDGTASSDGQDMLEVLKLSAYLPRVATAEYRAWPDARKVALTLASKNGYKALNMAGRAGELKPGHAADLSLWDLSALSMLPRTDPLSTLVYGSRTQARGAGAALAALWVRGVQVVDDGSPCAVDLPKFRDLLRKLQPEYRDPADSAPSTTPATAAAEVEYRAALCLDDDAARAAGVPEAHAKYPAGRALYDPSLPLAPGREPSSQAAGGEGADEAGRPKRARRGPA